MPLHPLHIKIYQSKMLVKVEVDIYGLYRENSSPRIHLSPCNLHLCINLIQYEVAFSVGLFIVLCIRIKQG